MRNTIAIGGNLLVDSVKTIDLYPKPGMLVNIHSVSQCIGGCAGNTLTDIAIIDPTLSLKCFGRVGKDAGGKYVLDLMGSKGIDMSAVVIDENEPTSFTDVMTTPKERTFFHARGANANFCPADLPWDTMSDVAILHLGYILLLDAFDQEDKDYGTVMAKTLHDAQKRGIKTSIDVVSEEGERFRKFVLPCLPYCNYIIINEIEASESSGIALRDSDGKIVQEAVKTAIRFMFDRGVSDVVCIHSPEGGWMGTKDGEIAFYPSLNRPQGYIKGKVGAGDAFCAGILYSLYKGFSPEKSLRVASAAAAANLSEKNSIDGMRAFDEMMKLDTLYGI